MEKIEILEGLTKNTQIRKMTKKIEEKTKKYYGIKM
jgi:ribosomal protein S30